MYSHFVLGKYNRVHCGVVHNLSGTFQTCRCWLQLS